MGSVPPSSGEFMVAYTLAVVFLLITPGPGVLTTAGVGAGFGYRPGLRFLVGLFLGTNLVALAVASGLAAVVFSAPWVRVALVWVSTAFFLWLAARIALSGAKVGFIESAAAPGLTGGVILQFINPKAYAVNNLLFSGYAFHPQSLTVEIAIKLLIFNIFWVPAHLLWLAAGVGLKRLDLSPGAHRAINIAMALSLLAVVALAALSQR